MRRDYTFSDNGGRSNHRKIMSSVCDVCPLIRQTSGCVKNYHLVYLVVSNPIWEHSNNFMDHVIDY